MSGKLLSSNAVVFRAISYKRWISGDEVSPDAFMLRPLKNDRPAEHDLSMLTRADCSKDVCFAPQIKDCSGELVVEVGFIRSLGLEVIDDAEETGIPNHASILKLPLPEKDLLNARFLAGKLAKEAKIRKRPKI